MHRKYTDEQIEFLRVNSLGNDTNKLTQLFNERFNSNISVSKISALRYLNGFKSGLTGEFIKGIRRSPSTEFKKGQVSWNKGKYVRYSEATEFKKGQKPKNTHPVGTIMMRGDGYIYIKLKETEPSRFGWKQLHLYNYEKANGEIPKGHKVIFLDGDHQNCDVSNLLMITDSQLVVINRMRLIKCDPDLTRTAVIIANLVSKTYRMQNSSKRSQVRS